MNRIRLYNIAMIMLFGCSSIEGNIDGYTLWDGSNYNPKLHNFDKRYPTLAGKHVVYEESYMGNFSLYFTPEIVNEEVVEVPIIHCYSAALDLAERTEDENVINQLKCNLSIQNLHYATKPEYFYKVGDDSEPFEFRKVVEDWYKSYGEYYFIKEIRKDANNIIIFSAGDGCSITYSAIERKSDGKFIFNKSEVIVCS